MSKLKDLSGMKFGRLTVIDRAENKSGNTRWNCICKCGNKTKSHASSLISGKTKSCGCLGIKNATNSKIKHGNSKTKLYRIWSGMKKRCYNKKYDHFNNYGGKGIKVCDEWKNDFISFKNWALNNGYKEYLEIDRIDFNGNYEPNNCRFQNRTQQIRNRSNTVFIEFNFETKTLKEWCEIYNVNYKLVHSRYKKGWDYKKIFDI